MKKITLLLLCIATLGLASCEKKTYIPTDNSLKNYTFYASILPNQWQIKADADGSYYYVDINNQEIERYEDDGTIVSIARYDDDGYDALPFTFGTTRFSYTSYPGKIRVYLQNHYNQDNLPTRPTGQITARVVIVASTSK